VTRIVATAGGAGAVAGYAALWCVRDRKYRADILVHPEVQRQGLGTTLADAVMAHARTAGGQTLQWRARADHTAAPRFAVSRGAVETHRMCGYRLDLTACDPSSLAALRQPIAGLELEVDTLDVLRSGDPDWLVKLHDLLKAAGDDWPDPDPDPSGPWLIPFPRFERWIGEIERKDAFFVARDGERYVGFGSLFGLGTAVHPAYRGRGVATGLQACVVDSARADGLLSIDGASAGAPMQAVFRRLGYRPTWSEVRLVTR
jgi:GNAT superfamily N-acetyltransferase